MYIPLVLFFISLISIIIMIEHKLVLVRNGHPVEIKNIESIIPNLDKIKYTTLKRSRKFGYIISFIILRFFILSSNYIKTKSKLIFKILKNKIKRMNGNSLNEIVEKKEVSKYLRVISDYRQKIKIMKHKIKKEEGIE